MPPILRIPSILLYQFLFAIFSFAANQIDIDVFIEPQNEGIDPPLSGTITITHSAQTQIDPYSFTYKDRPLSANLIDRTTIGDKSTGTIISNYHFELPPQDPGIYTLTPISFRINHESYSSPSIKYEVKSLNILPSEHLNRVSQNIFTLETKIDGPSPLYPGQRARLVYYITYNQNIDLTTSDLPLLYPADFYKIGDTQIKEVQDSGITIQEISQEIEAVKPGTTHFKRSMIEGYAFEESTSGKKHYQSHKLYAEAPPIDVVVAHFPKENQPLSFNGMIGPSEIETAMLSGNEFMIGGKIELQISIKGAHNPEEIAVPNISCQPGFSGFFIFDDLLPAGIIKDSFKIFTMELRPTSTLIKEIPAIEISSFNPDTEDYLIYHSKPITIDVKQSLETFEMAPPSEREYSIADQFSSFSNINSAPAPELEIKISFQPILNNVLLHWMQTSSVLYILPVAALLLYLQIELKRKWMIWQEKNRKPLSNRLLKKALNNKDPNQSINLLKEALLYLLKERRISPNKEEEIKAYISHLEKLQYSGISAEAIQLDDIKKKGKELFK